MPYTHEGKLLRALVTFYEGTANELAEEMGITRNQFNYLYKQKELTDSFKKELSASLGKNPKWHEGEGTKRISVLLFSDTPENKKGSDNVDSLVNLKKIKDSTVANHSLNDGGQEINRLRKAKKQLQAEVNELRGELKKEKNENKKLLEAFRKLTERFTNLSERLINILTNNKNI